MRVGALLQLGSLGGLLIRSLSPRAAALPRRRSTSCKTSIFKNTSVPIPPASRGMVTLVVATTIDPASIGPASALLAMPGWHPGPSIRVSFLFLTTFIFLYVYSLFYLKWAHFNFTREGENDEILLIGLS